MPKQTNAYVKLKPNESIDSALKRFNSQMLSSGILNDLKLKEYYIKPSIKKRMRRLKNIERN